MALNTREMLRIMTFSAYDLQMLRMQMGLRLTANFRSKLKREAVATDEDEASMLAAAGLAEAQDNDDLSEEAKKLIDQLKDSYRRLTDGIARNRRLPERKGFKGDALISEFTELVLVDQYIQIEKDEKNQFTQLETVLELIPIYTEYLRDQIGIGPAMASVLISYFDPHKAERISDFWAYAGLDVAPDGRGRSRRAEHLIDREYKKRDGTMGIRKSVTYNPWLKSRLLGALAISFLRTPNCPWHEYYTNYKRRLETDPARFKITSVQYKKAYRQLTEGNDEYIGSYAVPGIDGCVVRDITKLWPPLRLHRAAMRYMVKAFLIELWVKWRGLEGLEITPTYYEAKMGGRHVA